MRESRERTALSARVDDATLTALGRIKEALPETACERRDASLSDAVRLAVVRGVAWIEEHGPVELVPRTKGKVTK